MSVDVTKCEYFRKLGKFNFCNKYDCNCGEFNCDFKYKQLIEENAELKEFKNGVAIDFKEALARIIRKQEQIQKLQQCLDDIIEMCKYDCEYECSNDMTKCGVCSCLEQRIQRRIKEELEG